MVGVALDDGPLVTAMRARELGRTAVEVGDPKIPIEQRKAFQAMVHTVFTARGPLSRHHRACAYPGPAASDFPLHEEYSVSPCWRMQQLSKNGSGKSLAAGPG